MKKITLSTLLMLVTMLVHAQDITFTFENARSTNDGSDYYYEADIYMVASTSFKVGSGQIYFTYNPDAFGDNIHASGNFEYSQPSGSILGETYGFPAYKDFVVNDNTNYRVSTSFQQGVSSGTITADNVTTTAKHLFSIKIKYEDFLETPNVAFESASLFLDQFFVACGPSDVGFPDCTNEPGAQLINDTFDSSGATLVTLGTSNIELSKVSIRPNPAKDNVEINNAEDLALNIKIYNTAGAIVFSTPNHIRRIDVSDLNSGVYYLKMNTGKASKTIKLIKE